jgi:multiple sugar transport system substrate-binding protein/raffinose/stachyose/melibiose transport system substrate-binding protein
MFVRKAIAGRILAAFLSMLMLVTLAACGRRNTPASTSGRDADTEQDSDASSDADEDKITIEALIWMPDVPAIPYDMARAFNRKYPNLHVDIQLIQDSEMAALEPRMAANNMPDFFTLTAGFFANELADGGFLLDVGGTAAWANTLEPLQSQWISPVKGVRYGISGGLCTTFIYYNKSLFEQAGITELPKDYQEFLALCKQIKNAGITPMLFTGGDLNTLSNSQYSYGLVNYVTFGDDEIMNGIANGTYEIPVEHLKKVYERVIDLPVKGFVNEGYISTDYMGSLMQFINGEAAMIFNGTWAAGNIFVDGLDFEIGCFLPPWNDPGEVLVPCLSTETGHALGATGDPEKEAAAKLFLEFWYGEGFHIFQNPRQCVPGQRMETITVPIVLAEPIIALMADLASYPSAQPLHFGFMPPALAGSMLIFHEMLTGSMTPARAAQAAIDAIAGR